MRHLAFVDLVRVYVGLLYIPGTVQVSKLIDIS